MKLEWGKKVSCPACAMHFYNLLKSPAVCPYCGNTLEENDKRKKTTLNDPVSKPDIDFAEDEQDVLEEVVEDKDNDMDIIKIKDFD